MSTVPTPPRPRFPLLARLVSIVPSLLGGVSAVTGAHPAHTVSLAGLLYGAFELASGNIPGGVLSILVALGVGASAHTPPPAPPAPPAAGS